MGEIFRAERPRATMAHTGERLSHGHGLENEIEHFHRYYLARHFCRDLRVLDIACGEGYGSALLGQVAASVIGVDIDPEAVAHAAETYPGDNLTFRTGSATAIPVEDATIDTIVSFETLEHFVDHDRFFAEARRVLRPGGKLILSTPDRDIFSPPGSTPTEYHVHELTRGEFAEALSRHFARCLFFSQRVLVGSAILRDPVLSGAAEPARLPHLVFERRGDTHIEMNEGLPRARYLLCVASDANDDAMPSSLFIDTGNLADPTGRTARLEAELEATRQAHRAELATLQRVHDELVERIDQDRTIQVAELNRQHEEDVKTVRREAAAQIAEREQRAAARARDERRARQEAETALARQTEAAAASAAGWEQHLQATLQAQAEMHASEIRPLRQAAAERDAILRSTTWRIASRPQRLAARFPKAGRVVRAGAKFAFWTATMQLGERTRRRRQVRRDLAVLAATPLFDRAWYLAQHPDVAAAGADPVMHYFWTGAAAGFDPHPLFDTSWYIARHPDIAASGRNPLAHYIETGAAAGHDPHTLFETPFYLARSDESGRPRPSVTPLEDYLARSVAEPVPPAPNRAFDPTLYLAEYPDAAAAGRDCLSHYVMSGAQVGHQPHPLFNPAWYAAAYPDSAGSPLAHYLREGIARGCFPSPLMLDCGRHITGEQTLSLPQSAHPDVSIIIPAYGHLFDTYRCLCAVLWRTGDVPVEVIVADDRPHAPIVALLQRFEGVKLRVNRVNLGFLRSCNEAARLATGRHLVFLNNDTEVGADWLRPMLTLADSDPKIGMVGCKLLNPDLTVQEAGGIFRSDGWGEPYGRGQSRSLGAFNFVRDVDCVTGACFLVPRACWIEVGGFDDDYAPAFYEEFDLAVTLQQRGLRVVYQPASEVVHHGSSSYGAETRDRQSAINHTRFCRKWASYLATRTPPGTRQFAARDATRYIGVVLVIDDRVPEPDRHAGGLTLHQYILLLRDLGLKVVYCPEDLAAHQPYTRNLQQRGIEVVTAPDTIDGWLSHNGREIDRIWIARPSIATAWLPALRRETGAAIYYYTHDLHYLRERRRFEIDGDWWTRLESERLRREEFAVFATADVVMSPSAEEAEIVLREVPVATARAIPPYLFASPEIPAAPPDAEAFAGRRDIVFVGGFAHPPNTDAAVWLAQDIFPRVLARVPDARLVIVGDRPPPEVQALAGPHVEITGYVPDLAPYYAAARMSLSPLRYGAGVKGKIVGSLQAAVPVVTTPVGAEGIGLQDGTDALIGETSAEIADCAIRLFEDADLCARLAAAGEAVVRERFSRDGARQVMRELFELS